MTHCANKTTARHFQHSWRFRTNKRDKRTGPTNTFVGRFAFGVVVGQESFVPWRERRMCNWLVPVCFPFRVDGDGSHYTLARPPHARLVVCYLSRSRKTIPSFCAVAGIDGSLRAEK